MKTNGGKKKKKTQSRHSELSFGCKTHWEPFRAILDVLRYNYITRYRKEPYTGLQRIF